MKTVESLLSMIIFLTLVFVTGCTGKQAAPQSVQQTMELESGKTLSLNIRSGSVHISAGESGVVEISGLTPEGIRLEERPDGIELVVESQGGISRSIQTELKIRIPVGVALEITSYAADVTMEDIAGQVKVMSVAGKVTAQRLRGDILLKSGRGDVLAEDCQGDVRVLGEHGLLQLVNLHGKVSSATIMGTIDFTGSILEGDDVFLETDHGPVNVTVLEPLGMRVKAWTASGDVACMIAGLQQTVDGCAGTAGTTADGNLAIKTVSGEIRIKKLP